jgi:predicted negative regulator of RcsB-dependent stress response
VKKEELEALEHDPVVDTTATVWDYLQKHRQMVTRAIGAVLVVAFVGTAFYYYNVGQKEKRQLVLNKALAILNAPVTQQPLPFTLTYQAEPDKLKAQDAAFREVVKQFPGSNEAAIAHYYLGVSSADNGKLDEAAKSLNESIRTGDKEIQSVARMVMADVQVAQNKPLEAEKTLQSIIDNPTVLVSKDQATMSLARLVARRDLAKAKALLEPLRQKSPAISRSAVAVLGEITAMAGVQQ